MKKILRIGSRLGFYVITAVIAICICHGAAFGQQGVVRTDTQRIAAATRVLDRNVSNLMGIPGVVGTSTGIGSDGSPVIKVFVTESGIVGVPLMVENVPVVVKTSGRFRAFETTDRHPRPVPIGVSTGHTDITAGTIGARVTDGVNVFALSNNHVYANSNDANIGDDILQPGPYDGGASPDDVIGTLYAFIEIEYCDVYLGGYYYSCPQINTVDAAIADVVDPETSEALVDFSTLSDGYGAPSADLHTAYGIPDTVDDADEDIGQLIEQSVQKYGRTTGLTVGTVDSINGTVDVCYNATCTLIARFEDQIIITPDRSAAAVIQAP